jgi:hypothetical protein
MRRRFGGGGGGAPNKVAGVPAPSRRCGLRCRGTRRRLVPRRSRCGGGGGCAGDFGPPSPSPLRWWVLRCRRGAVEVSMQESFAEPWRLPALVWICGGGVASSFSLASAGGGEDEAAVARGWFPADARSTVQMPVLAPVGSCGTSTQLVCYRAPSALGLVVVSSSSSPVASCCWWSSPWTTGVVVGLENLQGPLCIFSVCQGSFCSFFRTGGLRVGSSAWVRVWLLYTSLILNTYSFPQKKNKNPKLAHPDLPAQDGGCSLSPCLSSSVTWRLSLALSSSSQVK